MSVIMYTFRCISVIFNLSFHHQWTHQSMFLGSEDFISHAIKASARGMLFLNQKQPAR